VGVLGGETDAADAMMLTEGRCRLDSLLGEGTGVLVPDSASLCGATAEA